MFVGRRLSREANGPCSDVEVPSVAVLDDDCVPVARSSSLVRSSWGFEITRGVLLVGLSTFRGSGDVVVEFCASQMMPGLFSGKTLCVSPNAPCVADVSVSEAACVVVATNVLSSRQTHSVSKDVLDRKNMSIAILCPLKLEGLRAILVLAMYLVDSTLKQMTCLKVRLACWQAHFGLGLLVHSVSINTLINHRILQK